MRDPSPPPPYSEVDPVLNFNRIPRRQPSAPPSPDEEEFFPTIHNFSEFLAPPVAPYPQYEVMPGHQVFHRLQDYHPARTENSLVTFGPYPVKMTCSYCETQIITKTKFWPGKFVWLIIIGCIILGFWLIIPWFLCCIPCCVPSCLDVIHKCPFCKRRVGEYNRI